MYIISKLEVKIIGKFLDSYRQLRRANRKIRGRKKYLAAFPWFDVDTDELTVVNAKSLTSDKHYKVTNYVVGRGYDVGLAFELASKPIITEIECPKCGEIAPLNVHWQGFQCDRDNAIWEICK